MKDLLYYAQLALESVLSVFGVRPYEEPHYTVAATLGPGIEIRRYEQRVAAQAEAAGEEARDAAFRLLFGYISGPHKIAMTTPVETQETAQGLRMRFFLPARYSASSAPAPRDARVQILALPEETLATLRFSGRAAPAVLERRQGELLAAVAAAGWRAVGAPQLLFYDPPFALPFLRRNEIALRVARP